jgi:hypothetical protein
MGVAFLLVEVKQIFLAQVCRVGKEQWLLVHINYAGTSSHFTTSATYLHQKSHSLNRLLFRLIFR